MVCIAGYPTTRKGWQRRLATDEAFLCTWFLQVFELIDTAEDSKRLDKRQKKNYNTEQERTKSNDKNVLPADGVDAGSTESLSFLGFLGSWT